jgi:AraC-like DNA-binding protein
MKEVSDSRQITCYSCHAGLKEIILPIIYEDVLIAYLQIGQLRDVEGEDTTAEKLEAVARQYGLDADKLISLYKKTPAVSQEKLSSVYNILEILIKFFWMEGLISDSRSMLSVKIERYIEEHLSERIYIEDLCNKFFLSKNAIYELFRKEFNTTVNEFILQKRMRKAQKLLESELNLNITQISLLCGFSDYNYFIRSFKKHIGVSPLKFRKSIF